MKRTRPVSPKGGSPAKTPTKPKTATRSSERNVPEAASQQTVLLAVTGLSPAIVTETIWALVQENPAQLPSKVYFITTLTGQRKIEEQLFTPNDAFGGDTAWQALRKALGAGPDKLQAAPVEVLSVPNPATGRNEPLDDISTPAQNESAANCILERVRSLVENPDHRLVASIAGGRKTMGALLHAAMSLIARETDRITHVLVSSPYETMPGFFFPSQPGPSLTDRSGQLHAPSNATIHLADVPFVPLRNRFKELNQMPGSFAGLIQTFSTALQIDARPVAISLDYAAKRLSVDGRPLTTSRPVLLLVQFLLESRKKGRVFRDQPDAGKALLEWMEKGHPKKVERSLIPTVDKKDPEDFIRKKLSELRTLLRKFGVRWVVPERDLSLNGAELID
ncbi:MAG: CRISPR-associated ring nuclease Csm6 [Verrucomicrobiota bacterium]